MNRERQSIGFAGRGRRSLVWIVALIGVSPWIAEGPDALGQETDAGEYRVTDDASQFELCSYTTRPRHRCGCPHCREYVESTAPIDKGEAAAPSLDEYAAEPEPEGFSQDFGRLASTSNYARASYGDPRIVGDSLAGSGQLVFQGPTVLLPVFTPPNFYTASPNGAGTQFIVISNPNTRFDITGGGLTPGPAGAVIDTWGVIGAAGSSEVGNPGSATLLGIDAATGALVVLVSAAQPPGSIEFTPHELVVDLPGAGGTRRLKIAENISPFPEDRVFFNFNHFHNAYQTPGLPGSRGNVGVERYTFGFEKTFFQGLASVQLNVPFAATLDSDQFISQGGNLQGTEFGNLAAILKLALWSTDETVVATGMGITAPTADDTRVYLTPYSPSPLVTIENDAIHLIPYMAVQRRPGNGRCFWQAWASVDVDVNGNDVTSNLSGIPAGYELRDQTLLYLDGVLGYDLIRRPSGVRGCLNLAGVTPVVELHHTSSLEDADQIVQSDVGAGSIALGNLANNFDVLNMTFASHFWFGERGSITPGFVFPLTQEDNRFFDGEFVIQTNWRF